MTTDVIIRPYQKEDRTSIVDICAETGLLGEDIGPVFSHRKLFGQMITNYYVKREVPNAFVAESEGEVVGYFIGSTNRFAKPRMVLDAIPPTLKAIYNQLSGFYEFNPQNAEFLKWLVFRASSEMPATPKNAIHGHFNLRDGFRNEGLGTKMLHAFLEGALPVIEKRGITHLYGEVFAHKDKPEDYFLDAGFDTYDRKLSTLFQDAVEGPVCALCITKPLAKLL